MGRKVEVKGGGEGEGKGKGSRPVWRVVLPTSSRVDTAIRIKQAIRVARVRAGILPSVAFRNRRTRLVESVRPWLPRAVLALIPLPAYPLPYLPASKDCLVLRSPRHASRRRRHAHKVQRRGNQLRLIPTSSCQAVILQQRRELRRVLLRQRRALILRHKVTWLHPPTLHAPNRRRMKSRLLPAHRKSYAQNLEKERNPHQSASRNLLNKTIYRHHKNAQRKKLHHGLSSLRVLLKAHQHLHDTRRPSRKNPSPYRSYRWRAVNYRQCRHGRNRRSSRLQTRYRSALLTASHRTTLPIPFPLRVLHCPTRPARLTRRRRWSARRLRGRRAVVRKTRGWRSGWRKHPGIATWSVPNDITSGVVDERLWQLR